MKTKFKTFLKFNRDRRDARGIFEATKHLDQRILRDIGITHKGNRAFGW